VDLHPAAWAAQAAALACLCEELIDLRLLETHWMILWDLIGSDPDSRVASAAGAHPHPGV